MLKYNASRFPLLRRATVLLLAAQVTACISPAGNEATPAPEPVVGTETAPVPAAVATLADADQARAFAGDLSLREDAPLRYTVKKGDTLWDIAQHFLRDPWQWPELWYTNSQVRNPHQIYPGDVLSLVSVGGRTRLAFDGTVDRLSPRIREAALDASLPAIPIEAIRNFLRGPRLVTLEETRRAPYIVAFADERLAVGANSDVYVKNLPAEVAYNYAVVRVGEPYRDPDSGALLGYEAIPTGEAELREPGTPAQMRVTKSNREVLVADRLLPIEAESFDANFYPHPPTTDINGRIISVYDGLSQISQYQIVALNRGTEQGLDPGTVLDIYQPGRRVPDPYGKGTVTIPEQRAGMLMVFKVTPMLSYGLVMNATRPLHVLDKVAKPSSSEP